MNLLRRIWRKLKREYRKYKKQREAKKKARLAEAQRLQKRVLKMQETSQKRLEALRSQHVAADEEARLIQEEIDAKKAHQDRLEQHYVEMCETYPVDEQVVLVESQRGKGMDESVLILARMLSEKNEYRTYVSCVEDQMEERALWMEKHGVQNIELLAFNTEEYYRILATAGTLINEDNFGAAFIKRPEQKFVRLWNATPVNVTGRHAAENYGMIGNTQRSILEADYLLCPNRFTLKILEKEFMLANLATTRVLMSGRLENEVFVTDTFRSKIRAQYGWEEKKVFAYLPALRTYEESRQKEYALTLAEHLRKLDELLSDGYEVIIKVPYEVRKHLKLKEMLHITQMPDDYTPYQVLSATDGLITDYSAIMMDYAVSQRKIIRFPFDEEEFLRGKHRYQPMEEFPFATALSAEELAKEITSGIGYDATAFYEKYCSCMKPGMAEAVYQKVFSGEDSPILQETRFADNGKKNVLIYAGSFAKNGITTAIHNMLESVDRNKYNYYVYYRMGALRNNQEELKKLPEEVGYYSFNGVSNLSEQDAILYAGWKEEKTFPYEKIKDILYKRAKREYRRMLEFCRIDHVIQFDGYGEEVTLLMENMPCGRTIYAHNDMVMELKKKAFVRKEVLRHAYQTYDNVAIVTPDLKKSAGRVAKGKATLKVAKNVIDYKRILRLAKEPLVLNGEKTELNVEADTLRGILASDAKKFITIGRFSPEKGHLRLMDAFEKVLTTEPDAYLIILGGYGPLYEETKKKAAEMGCSDRIIIIKYLANPYPLLKQCDYFVLSSFYEGFGLVLAEADILGIPCFSTNITGPKKFMRAVKGMLVSNSTAGIVRGMRACLSGKVPKRLQIDYEKYNKEAVEQFESLMKVR